MSATDWPKKTTVVCQILGVRRHRLDFLIYSGQLAAPAKDQFGNFLWSETDVAAARAALSGTVRLRGALRELVARTRDAKVKKWLVRLVEDPEAATLLPDPDEVVTA
jgi:hypothetical protein